MRSVLLVAPPAAAFDSVPLFVENLKRYASRYTVTSFFAEGRGALRAFPRLTRLAHESQFDIVHINTFFDYDSLLRDGALVWALRVRGIRRVVLHFHGGDLRFLQRTIDNVLGRRLLAGLLNNVAAIFVPSQGFSSFLLKMGVRPERLTVVREMFDGQGLRPVEGEAAPSRRKILFMARFDREKGGRELLRAFADVSNLYPDVDLVMAGEGDDKAFMQAQVETLDLQDRVSFPGYVSGEVKAKLLRDCTVFALPAYFDAEGIPVAILEGMGAGKALLVGAAMAMRDFISDPENGVILGEITSASVASGLRRLLDHGDQREAAGKRNAALAWGRCEASQVTAEIEAFYDILVQG